MKIFLKILAVIYFIGFGLHAADVLNLRIIFSEMTPIWKCWTAFLMLADICAARYLWKGHQIGIRLFQFIALLQIAAYIFFKDIFGNQSFLIIFHVVCLTVYTTLTYLNFKKKT